MVKVVGGGFRATCANCGSSLEFTQDDTRAGEHMANNPEQEYYTVITCPRCRRAVDVTSVVGRSYSRPEFDYSDYDL
ncbi:MAG: hypothetical protein PVI21_03660 [Candidatus Woesebacteria bacterium]|jgi:hypothetical protein